MLPTKIHKYSVFFITLHYLLFIFIFLFYVSLIGKDVKYPIDLGTVHYLISTVLMIVSLVYLISRFCVSLPISLAESELEEKIVCIFIAIFMILSILVPILETIIFALNFNLDPNFLPTIINGRELKASVVQSYSSFIKAITKEKDIIKSFSNNYFISAIVILPIMCFVSIIYLLYNQIFRGNNMIGRLFGIYTRG